MLNDIAVERNARNAHRQRDYEVKQLARLVKQDSGLHQDVIEEKEVIIKELNVIIDNKGAAGPPCENCSDCKTESGVCNCFCVTCEQVFQIVYQLHKSLKINHKIIFRTVS